MHALFFVLLVIRSWLRVYAHCRHQCMSNEAPQRLCSVKLWRWRAGEEVDVDGGEGGGGGGVERGAGFCRVVTAGSR